MPNRLAHTRSPYLLQHADNPVDWYPWGPEALELARSTGKPILLSVGYSACHWCHVMAHECFEDPEVAAVMNQLFINIKVDREQRPDIDRIYQHAYQLLNQRAGGWPLTAFLTHDDQVPFFLATYLPKTPRYGLPGFIELMRKISGFYQANPDKVREQNHQLLQVLNAGPGRLAVTGYSIHPQPLADLRQQLSSFYDPQHGGFGKAPKFPQPSTPEWLLDYCINHPDDPSARQMLEHTLERMANSGLYDALAGGFFRYSVDERWEIPHFEKMLYDNGQLLSLYSRAWVLSPQPRYQQVVEETIRWLQQEMLAPEGGFYSALDADSEGHEGKFYLWQPEQIQTLLSTDEYALFSAYYGLDQAANFEQHAYHLHTSLALAPLAAQLGLSVSTAQALLHSAHAKLLAVRNQRIRPGRDEKILTAWNALTVRGLALAGRIFQRPEWLALADQVLAFIQRDLWQQQRLLASYSQGQAEFAAYLDDYTFLAEALLERLASGWNAHYFDWLQQLLQVLFDHFQDARKGGFYFTADDHEALITRPKPFHEDALPCANGVLTRLLLRLGRLLSHMPWLVASEKTLKWAWPMLEGSPQGCLSLASALGEYYHPSRWVVLRGDAATLAVWTAALANQPLQLLPIDALTPEQELPAALASKTLPTGASAAAYICQGTQCSAVVTELEALLQQLRG